jgi:predicted RND superfamily exporter protein
VSFISTCISPIMPICSFGIFASIVISINYILVITVIPNIYLLYEKNIRKKFNCCSKIKNKVKKSKKYDDMQEVLIPKNVDIEESLLQD